MRPREALVNLVAQNLRGGFGLGQPVGRNLAVKALRQQGAGLAVFQPVQYLAHDAKARGHQAAGIARMHAFGQDLHLQYTTRHAAQRSRQPKLVVVASAGIQADHQTHIPQARTQGIHIRQQIVRAAFFAGFNQAHNARVRHVLAFQRLNGCNAGVHRITVIGAAPAKQLAVFVLGRPGTQVTAPACELGLLVEVAVHQHGFGGADFGGWHLEKQHGGASFHPDNLQLEAFDLLRLDPGRRIAHHGFDVAMASPVLVERR